MVPKPIVRAIAHVSIAVLGKWCLERLLDYRMPRLILIKSGRARGICASQECARSTTMLSIFRIAALGAITLLPAQASAEQLAQAHSKLAPVCLDIVHLGSVSAMTYYTEEQDGFRVVTTIQEDGRDTPVPVRFVTILQPGQRAIVSVPAEPGVKAWALDLVRDGDRPVPHPPNPHPPTEFRAPPPPSD